MTNGRFSFYGIARMSRGIRFAALLSARLPRYSFAIQNAFQKVWARPQARPENFFSTSKFSIADWKGGMGHGFEKFICLLQNHLQRFRCFPPLDKIFEPSKLRQEAGAKDLRQVKTR